MLHSSSAGVGTYRKTTVKRRHPKAQQSSTVPPPPATAAEALAAETNGTADNTNNNTARGSKRRTIPPPVVESTTKKSGSHKKAVQKGPVFSLRTTDRQRAIYEALDGLMASPLPELQEPQEIKTYSEASLEETLYKLIENNDVIMVAGAFFGDEGKGKTVDAVAHHPLCTCIARTNSGENAGHTVYDKEGRKFVFNLAPSGLLTPGKKNYIGPECVLDPISFMEKEVKQLLDAGIEYHDTLFIGNACIVTPYHKLLDLLGSAVNASTLKGMAPVHASKVTKRGIRLDHIFNDEETLRERLSKDMETYFGLMKVQGLKDSDVVRRCHEENSDGVERVPKYVIDFARSKDKVQFLLDLYRTRVRENPEFPTRCDVIHTLRAAIQNGEKVLLEGPQSYWLSNAREHFWCSTTSADTTAAGLLATAQLNFQNCRAVVINVHKAPASSRVGLGACPCSFVPQDFFSGQGIKTLHDLPENMCADFDAIQHKYFTEAYKNIDDPESFKGIAEPIEYTDSTGIYNIGVAMAVAGSIHHGECGAVTRKPRICGLFDCVLQSEVSAVQGPYLSISALDRGDDYDRVGVTIAYIYYSPENIEVDVNGKKYKNGDIIRAGDPVPGEAALYHCHPITKLVKGWKESPIAATVRQQNDPLPDGLCEFLATVEHFCGCKVLSIGNGPSGDDIIYLQQDEEEDEEEE
uniref:Adenylosuccinate synthetase n=1 Tax=Herpetomonas muscarum TaxID=5718 RepID=U5KL64_HERMU|nr:adenylosuccinate synthase [Herpetomonas muscarum]